MREDIIHVVMYVINRLCYMSLIGVAETFGVSCYFVVE
jgi:hypothetical protein